MTKVQHLFSVTAPAGWSPEPVVATDSWSALETWRESLADTLTNYREVFSHAVQAAVAPTGSISKQFQYHNGYGGVKSVHISHSQDCDCVAWYYRLEPQVKSHGDLTSLAS